MKRHRKVIRWSIRILLLGALGLALVLTFNTIRFRSRQLDVPAAEVIELPEQAIVDRFAQSLSIPTVSHSLAARIDDAAFDRFLNFMEESFPLVHQNLSRMTGSEFGDEGNRSLLYKWSGSGGEQEKAILLMGHYDVVPIEEASRESWTQPPFGGIVDLEYIWGRGAIDDKCAAMGLLEAIEYLIASGYQPTRTIYVSLGHDEELGGQRGNKLISEWMKLENIKLEYVLDEGGGIFNDFAGVNRPTAFVGIGEKGFVTYELTVDVGEAGHASMPPPISETALGILGEALRRLDRNPFPSHLEEGMGLTLDYVGPEMSFANRVVIANRWLLGPLLVRQLGKTPLVNASLRTTIAPTMIQGGVKDNVLPSQASMTLNIRIHPKDNPDYVKEHIEETVGELGVCVEPSDTQRKPSRLSSTESDSFGQVHRTIREIYPDVIVAPFIVVAATDSSHFDDPHLSDNVYRFVPWRLGKDDLKRIHGIDERLARSDYIDIVRFYVRLIRNTASSASDGEESTPALERSPLGSSESESPSGSDPSKASAGTL